MTKGHSSFFVRMPNQSGRRRHGKVFVGRLVGGKTRRRSFRGSLLRYHTKEDYKGIGREYTCDRLKSKQCVEFESGSQEFLEQLQFETP